MSETPRGWCAAGRKHADYPAFRHVFPGRTARKRVLRAFFTATARDAARQGGSLVAREGARVLGTALWMPLGTFPLTPVRKARMTPALVRVALAAPRGFPAFARIGARLEQDSGGEPGWYLQAMGVHPSSQRRGLGQRLLAPVLDAADAARLPCHLHTSEPANVDYYRRHGFEVDDPQIEVFPAGPRYVGMIRRPRT